MNARSAVYSPLCNDVVCAYADDIGMVGAHCTMPGGCFYESSAGEGDPPVTPAAGPPE